MENYIKTVQGDYMPKIKQYAAELTRKKDELFKIDVDSVATKDSHLKLSEGLDDNNPMITIVFKPEDIAGKKTIRFEAVNFKAVNSKSYWDIKFSDGIKFDRIIIPQK
jgi:hypothetical protein